VALPIHATPFLPMATFEPGAVGLGVRVRVLVVVQIAL